MSGFCGFYLEMYSTIVFSSGVRIGLRFLGHDGTGCDENLLNL